MANHTKEATTEGTSLKDLACDHNGFAHRVFPYVVRRYGADLFELLSSSSPYRSEILAETCATVEEHFPREDDSALLFLKDISITEAQLSKGKVLILSLTPPAHPIGVYFIGLFASSSEPLEEVRLRYFTFERLDEPDDQAILCEWEMDDEGNLSHRNFGYTGSLTPDAFKEGIELTTALFGAGK